MGHEEDEWIMNLFVNVSQSVMILVWMARSRGGRQFGRGIIFWVKEW